MPHFRTRMRELRSYENTLRDTLLSELPRDPTATYSSRQILLLKGYCILAHAAIEEYVEQTARELIDWHCQRWTTRVAPKPTIVLMALLSHHEEGYKKQLSRVGTASIVVKDNIGERINKAQTAFINIVNANNGIGLHNIAKMLRPTGISLQIDADTESALGQLKKYRGEYAHRGSIAAYPSVEDLEALVARCLSLCATLAVESNALCERV